MDEEILKGKTLLVVDDEADLREIVSSELEFMGAKVFQAENVSVAKSILNAHKIDLIVSDIRMPGGTGIDLLNFIKAKSKDVPPIILITGFADISTEDAFNQGAEALLSKPFKLEELIQMAIKLTSPTFERYVHPVASINNELEFLFNDILNRKIESHECAIGRGGITLKVDTTKANKWDSGDLLNFNLRFQDVDLQGTAICRWWKSQENSSKATFGLEFVQLSDETYDFFNHYWQGHTIIPFIPSLDSRPQG